MVNLPEPAAAWLLLRRLDRLPLLTRSDLFSKLIPSSLRFIDLKPICTRRACSVLVRTVLTHRRVAVATNLCRSSTHAGTPCHDLDLSCEWLVFVELWPLSVLYLPEPPFFFEEYPCGSTTLMRLIPCFAA